MKKIIYKIAVLCFLAFVYSNDSKAQGNLQFNQVKLVSASDTVPTNKVWKVESITYPNPAVNSYVILNGVGTLVRHINVVPWGAGTAGLVWEMKYPFWLPAGSSISANSNVNLISVIEYNIIP